MPSRRSAGSIDSRDLNSLIHAFDRGPALALFETYRDLPPDVLVNRAVTRGVLDREAVPAEILELLEDEVKVVN